MDPQGAAAKVAAACEPATGLRIFHVTDFHNRREAFRTAAELAKVLRPAFTICTGDLSGIGGPLEKLLLKRWWRVPGPVIFAPGNHDGAATISVLRKLGATVLGRPAMRSEARAKVWGYPDPNNSRLLFGPRYSSNKCRRAAESAADSFEQMVDPFIVAVHNDEMVPRPLPDHCRLVLSGHWHRPRVTKEGESILVRTGNAGGVNRFSSDIHMSLIDLNPRTYEVLDVRLIAIGKNELRVEKQAL